MLTVICLLALVAFIVAILSKVTDPPRDVLWVAVVLLAIAELLRCLPVGH